MRVIGAEHRAAHARLRRELGCDRAGGAGFVPAMAAVGDAAERTLRELVASQVTLEGFEERARHVLAVGEAEARREGSLRWFGASLWSERSFARAVGMAVGEDRRPAARASPSRLGPTAQALELVREYEAEEAAERERRAGMA